MKRQRAAGKHLFRRVAGCGLLWRWKVKFRLEQRAVGVPEFCGGSFRHELEAVVPGPLANRAEVLKPFLEKLNQCERIVRQALEFHGT